MIVCLCHGVSDRAIRDLIGKGARHLEEVTACSRAGAGCGACVESISTMIRDAGGQGQEMQAAGRLPVLDQPARRGP